MSMRYRKVMVTLDGSTLAAQALPHALTLVMAHHAELILFRVVPQSGRLGEFIKEGALDTEQRDEQRFDEATQALTTTAEELKLHGIQVKAVVEAGLPAETIIDYATEKRVDLVVMSTHGRSGLARWVYGSVADKVLRAALCPVLLIRASLA